MNFSAFGSSGNRWFFGLLLAATLVIAISAGAAPAAPNSCAFAAEASAPLVGSFLQDIVGNRTRLVQASIIFVLFGIALLFKK